MQEHLAGATRGVLGLNAFSASTVSVSKCAVKPGVVLMDVTCLVPTERANVRADWMGDRRGFSFKMQLSDCLRWQSFDVRGRFDVRVRFDELRATRTNIVERTMACQVRRSEPCIDDLRWRWIWITCNAIGLRERPRHFRLVLSLCWARDLRTLSVTSLFRL